MAEPATTAAAVGHGQEPSATEHVVSSNLIPELCLPSTPPNDDNSTDDSAVPPNTDQAYTDKHVTPNKSPLWPHGSPWRRAGPFSKLTFRWINPLIYRGQRPQLTEKDMPPLDESDDCRVLSDRLHQAWIDELGRVALHPSRQPSLPRVLWHTLRPLILLSGAVNLLVSLLKIAEAILLGQFILFFQTPTASTRSGVGWASALVAVGMLHALAQSQFLFPARRLGFQARTGLIALLYKKMMRLSASSPVTTGEAINIISNDTQCFETLAPLMHYLWLGPLELIVAVGIMCSILGWPALIGIGIIGLTIPISTWMTRQLMLLRAKMVVHRDKRIRLLGDVLRGIELVKLSAWETPLEESINKERDLEIGCVFSTIKYLMFLVSFFANITGFLALAIFSVYAALGHQVQPNIVFSSLALLNVIRLAIALRFPLALRGVAESMVSSRRIVRLLLLPETTRSALCSSDDYVDDYPVVLATDESQQTVLSFDRANFRWPSTGESHVNTASMVGAVSTTTGEAANAMRFNEHISTPLGNHVLFNISFTLADDELMMVLGPVGSGKSSLCMAILQELLPVSGRVHFPLLPRQKQRAPKIAYVQQQPLILSANIRDNILFGEPFNDAHYARVIHACALQPDLDRLPLGDQTHVGERGVTLSGGQKARVALARAVYMSADLYLFDDPLSAVDPRVGRHLFNHAVQGLLAGRPRILVTHQLQFAAHADHLLLLENGSVSVQGTPREVVDTLQARYATPSPMQGFLPELLQYLQADATPDTDDSDGSELAVLESDADTVKVMHGERGEEEVPLDEAGRLIAEESEHGSIPMASFWRYLRFGGAIGTLFLLLLVTIGLQVCLLATDWYLASWSSAAFRSQDSIRFQTIYSALVLFSIAFGIFQTAFSLTVLLNAARWLFRGMLHSVLETPIHFFHAHPHGRILNRFSKDQAHTDEQLPHSFYGTVMSIISLLGFVVVVCIVNPYMVIAAVLLASAFVLLRQRFARVSRQVRRIESVTRSPVYSQLSEGLHGLVTMRSFGAQQHFWHRFSTAQNCNSSVFFAFIALGRWIGFRMDFLGALFLTSVAYAAILLRTSMSAAFVGLSLNYIIQFIGMLQWCIEQSIELEMTFISVERIMNYTDLDREPPRHTDMALPEKWPAEGAIEFRNMSLTYPNTDAPVLRDISLEVKPGEKIGVVGRTGAGKSSLLTALFRLTEPSPAGCILIDGVPISQVGLHDLRSRLAIIPQIPVLFRGTIRFNLDPFHRHSDAELWQAIEAAELKERIAALPEKLDAHVSDDGDNFSVGERQLISLCRAILRNARIVVMDEATANVDLATDRRIQRAIRRHFRTATVLTIAHRLDTVVGAMAVCHAAAPHSTSGGLSVIAEDDALLPGKRVVGTPQAGWAEEEGASVPLDDTTLATMSVLEQEEALGCDRVMVLDAGELREFGPPNALLLLRNNIDAGGTAGNGWLRQMMLDTGEVGERTIRWLEQRQSRKDTLADIDIDMPLTDSQ